MEFVEGWEHGLKIIVGLATLVLESISVLCVITGLLKTIQFTWQMRIRHRSRDEFPFNQIRLNFGTWLALALEFQLAADILATTMTPTLQDLGKLAIVAVVRTFLNFFLGKELEVEMEMENRRREHEFQLAKDYESGLG